MFFSYKLRIESMLLKEEFASNMGYLEPSINSMITAAQGKALNLCKYIAYYMLGRCLLHVRLNILPYEQKIQK